MTSTARVKPFVITAAMPGTGWTQRLRTEPLFIGAAAFVYAASVVITIAQCLSMATMDAMPMPGGWTMSMLWMRMPGQSWPGHAAMFLGMWCVMMLAMMGPALLQSLTQYRQGLAGHPRLNALTVLVSAGYLLIWNALGLLAYALGLSFATLAMQSPALAQATPLATGILIVLAGLLQLRTWKRKHLRCCRGTLPQRPGQANGNGALQYGLRLGRHCIACCLNLMLILLAIDAMDLRAMAIITAAITLERFAPAEEKVANALSLVIIAAGLFLIARAV